MLSTSPDQYLFHDAMTTVGNWLQSIIENGSWRQSAVERRIDMQRLVSRAHMAIESQKYDTKARYQELQSIAYQTHDLMLATKDTKMHPRVLTSLMRFWIADWQDTPWKQQMLGVVKDMICRTAHRVLGGSHPINVLSRLASRCGRPDEMIMAFFWQYKTKLADRVINKNPDFAVREQIYFARVLASIKRPSKAVQVLEQTELRPEVTASTLADYHSTLGYAFMQNGLYPDAIQGLKVAVDKFDLINEGKSEGAEYAHFCLSTCYENLDDLPLQEYHLVAALRAWESNAVLQNNQGGIKIVRDLHGVYEKQGKSVEMRSLERKYSKYFEGIPPNPS